MKSVSNIVMIVGNSCVSDSRVIKEAETLAAHGFAVRVVCRQQHAVADAEDRNGVQYVRVPMGFDLLRSEIWLDGSVRNPGARSVSDGAGVDCLTRAERLALGIMRKLLRTRRSRSGGGDGKALRSAGGSEEEPAGTERGGAAVPGASRGKRGGFIGKESLLKVLNGTKSAVGLVLKYPLMTMAVEYASRSFRPEIVHAHDLVALPAAVRMAEKFGAKVVYDSHELEIHRNGLGRLERWINAHVERSNINAADAVITVCDSISRYLAARYGIRSPLVVMNAPDLTRAKHCQATVRDHAGIPAEIPLAVYVGKLTAFRGIEQTIEALVHAEEFHFAAIGPGAESKRRHLRELAARLGVASRCHVLSSVLPEELIAYIGTADVGVVPTQNVCLSYEFSLPNKLFEMTFAGLPVCVSNLLEQVRFVELAGNGVVMNGEQPEDIARAMREAYSRRAALRPDRERFDGLVEEFAWKAQAEKLTSLYEGFGAAGEFKGEWARG